MKPLARHLPRPRLRDALLRAECRLRLLRAPAGSGKTALLDECLALCPQGTRLLRLDLRGRPLDATTLCMRLGEGLGLADGRRETLLDALEQSGQALWLVLDGYPHFPDAELDRQLNELVLLCSPRVHWWITSRRRPRLQLTRLLLNGELFELNAAELAFTASELAALLPLLGLEIPERQWRALLERSAGWCAGVRLALLGLHPAQALPPESGAVLLVEYLRCEVLDALPADWRMGLFSLAHLPCFDHALCEQLIGVDGGAQLLDDLLECGLFLEPLEAGSRLFRIQPALAPTLARLLPRALVRPLYGKVSQWFLGQGQVRQAVEYAFKAGQPEMAAILLQQFGIERLLQGKSMTLLLEWRRELPEELLVSTPSLVLLNAWASLLGGRLADGQRYMAALQRHLPQADAQRQHGLLAQYAALQAMLAMLQGAAGCSDGQLLAVAEDLPAPAWSQRLLCQLLRIERLLGLGRLEVARERVREGQQQAREHGSLAFESLFVLAHARLLEIRGELLHAAGLLARLRVTLWRARGNEANPIHGRVLLCQASLQLQQGHYEEAGLLFREGLCECRSSSDPAAVLGYLGLADLRALAGDFSEAYMQVAEAERLMQYGDVAACLYEDLLLACRARLAIQQRRYPQAGRMLRSHGAAAVHPLLGFSELRLRLRALQLLARLQCERGQGRVCLLGLRGLHAEAQAAGRRVLACELGFMLAEGLQAEGDAEQARRMLREILEQARQMGLAYVETVFFQRRPDMRDWEAADASVEWLSGREREVLELIARGLSNQQIAEALLISLQTVKSHASHINSKLGVARRTQAVARAKELGMLAH